MNRRRHLSDLGFMNASLSEKMPPAVGRWRMDGPVQTYAISHSSEEGFAGRFKVAAAPSDRRWLEQGA